MQFIKDSVFISALRSFCSSFMAVLGVLLAIVLTTFLLAGSFSEKMLPEKSTLTVLPDALGSRTIHSLYSPAILCLNIKGVIGMNDLVSDSFRNLLLDSREGMLANNRVKGILLLIDSPGGTVTDSDNIYRAIKEYSIKHKVPVYAYVDGLCASGGMYIASSAEKVMATSSSIIGSVGVRLGPWFNFTQAMEKYGVSSMTITEGKDKDMMNPFRAWKEGEDQSLRDVTADMYTQFVDIVTCARPLLDKQKLLHTYGAQVYIAKTAQEYGYIDESGSSYASTLNELTKTAGILEGEAYQVVQLTPTRSLLQTLSSGSVISSVMEYLGFAKDPAASLSGKFLFLYAP